MYKAQYRNNMNKTERFNQQLTTKAKKYYGTTDLSKLTPYQLEKIATWMTWGEDTGKNKSRKAAQALTQNKKYQGKHTKALTNST